MGEQERIENALAIAADYGQTDGAHHKAWVIDQMVRALTGCPSAGVGFGDSVEYQRFVTYHNDCEGGPDTYDWDEGVAP